MKQVVKISSAVIQLNQLLKWIGVLETGGQISFLLDEGVILVNGTVVHEKRKKIYPGDTVRVEKTDYFVLHDDEIEHEC